jgi:hypothetical protein
MPDDPSGDAEIAFVGPAKQRLARMSYDSFKFKNEQPTAEELADGLFELYAL